MFYLIICVFFYYKICTDKDYLTKMNTFVSGDAELRFPGDMLAYGSLQFSLKRTHCESYQNI